MTHRFISGINNLYWSREGVDREEDSAENEDVRDTEFHDEKIESEAKRINKKFRKKAKICWLRRRKKKKWTSREE